MKSLKLLHIFAIVVTVTISFVVRAQDFEADSVYYTPIAKEPQEYEKKGPRKIFTDTTKNSVRFQYFFNVQVGPLIGCNDCSGDKDITFTSSTLHGITLGRKLRVGLGVGFDSYDSWQTLPLYGSVSWDLLGTKNTQALYLQFDYGWSAAWRQRDQFEYGFTDSGGGKMYNALVGYRIKYHDLKIGLAIGSKSQQVYTYYESPSYYYNSEGILVQGAPNRTTVKKEMSRLIFSLSVGWK